MVFCFNTPFITSSMFFVYILLSEKTGKYYIGSTGDVDDRLYRHNSGQSKYTKSGLPWALVYREEYSTRGEAMKRENEIKRWKSHKRISVLINSSSD